MKVALCFIISYKHIVNKEQIWIDWIEPNKDIINVYFHYTNFSLIKSEWIKKHVLPKEFIMHTDYAHVVPAYLSLLLYGLTTDEENKWFCFLTESCSPIVSPQSFRKIFMENYNKTIMSWKRAYWNPNFTKRANLDKLQEEFHLTNTPWFIINKDNALILIKYSCDSYSTTEDNRTLNELGYDILIWNQKKYKWIIHNEFKGTQLCDCHLLNKD